MKMTEPKMVGYWIKAHIEPNEPVKCGNAWLYDWKQNFESFADLDKWLNENPGHTVLGTTREERWAFVD
jgi:hypothetical protein